MKSLYLLAVDKEAHSWEEILASSREVLDLTPASEEGVYFKEAVAIGKDCVVIWRKKGENYVVRDIFVSIKSPAGV